jgi:hypothetical protein
MMFCQPHATVTGEQIRTLDAYLPATSQRCLPLEFIIWLIEILPAVFILTETVHRRVPIRHYSAPIFMLLALM